MALWSGRFTEGVSEFTQQFGASLPVDKALYAQDIAGSKAHAHMLAAQGVISQEACPVCAYDKRNHATHGVAGRRKASRRAGRDGAAMSGDGQHLEA